MPTDYTSPMAPIWSWLNGRRGTVERPGETLTGTFRYVYRPGRWSEGCARTWWVKATEWFDLEPDEEQEAYQAVKRELRDDWHLDLREDWEGVYAIAKGLGLPQELRIFD